MFRRLFNWSAKSEEELMKEPRRVPDEYKDVPDGDDKWIMSREFVNSKKPNLRMYMSARKNDGYSGWTIHRINYDLDDESVRYQETGVAGVSTPMQVVQYFLNFERDITEGSGKAKYDPMQASYPTFILFANRYGMHVSGDKEIIEINRDDQIQSEVFISSRSLRLLFDSEAALLEAVDTWEGLYARLLNRLPYPEITPDKIAADQGYAVFAKKGGELVRRLEQISETILSSSVSRSEKEKKIGVFHSNVELGVLAFDESGKSMNANFLADASILISLLRMGHDLYAEQFKLGLKFPNDMMNVVAKIGATASEIAVKRLGMSEADAKRITGIIGSGRDPFGPALPLEAWLNLPLPAPKPPVIDL